MPPRDYICAMNEFCDSSFYFRCWFNFHTGRALKRTFLHSHFGKCGLLMWILGNWEMWIVNVDFGMRNVDCECGLWDGKHHIGIRSFSACFETMRPMKHGFLHQEEGVYFNCFNNLRKPPFLSFLFFKRKNIHSMHKSDHWYQTFCIPSGFLEVCIFCHSLFQPWEGKIPHNKWKFNDIGLSKFSEISLLQRVHDVVAGSTEDLPSRWC